MPAFLALVSIKVLEQGQRRPAPVIAPFPIVSRQVLGSQPPEADIATQIVRADRAPVTPQTPLGARQGRNGTFRCLTVVFAGVGHFGPPSGRKRRPGAPKGTLTGLRRVAGHRSASCCQPDRRARTNREG